MSLRNVRYLVFPLYASVILTLLKYRHTEVYSTYSLSKNLLYWNYVNNPWQIFQQEKPSSNKVTPDNGYILHIDTDMLRQGILILHWKKRWFYERLGLQTNGVSVTRNGILLCWKISVVSILVMTWLMISVMWSHLLTPDLTSSITLRPPCQTVALTGSGLSYYSNLGMTQFRYIEWGNKQII